MTTSVLTVTVQHCAYLSSCLCAVGSRRRDFADAKAKSAVLARSAKAPYLAIADARGQDSRGSLPVCKCEGELVRCNETLCLLTSYNLSEDGLRHSQPDAGGVGCTLPWQGQPCPADHNSVSSMHTRFMRSDGNSNATLDLVCW